MNLQELKNAVNTTVNRNHAILVYGPSKSGKTAFVGTAATIPEINHIYWFDIENGIETLLASGLTDEQLAKITPFRLRDLRDDPVGIETMLKVFSAKTPIDICNTHGRVSCIECKTSKAPSTSFHLGQVGHNDLIVIDSGSQLGDSALAAACKGRDILFKPGWDEYALQGKWLGEILTVCQQAARTNFVIITHECIIEEEINEVKKDKIVPLIGSKAFSMKCAKYFGTVAYLHLKLGKHVAGSSSTYKSDTLTGSRVNAKIETEKTPTMRDILVKGGILKATTPAPTSAQS